MICDYCGTLILDAPFRILKSKDYKGKYNEKVFCSNKCIDLFLNQNNNDKQSYSVKIV